MSLQTDKLNQMYKVLQTMKEMLFEAHCGCIEATQAVEYQMYELDELFKPVEITHVMVAELRELTGEGIMSCNKELQQARGNMTFAVDILRNSGNICKMNDSHWSR